MRRAQVVAVAGFALSAACVASLHVVRADLSPVAHRMSEYALGRQGWLMTTAFATLGCGLIALALVFWKESRPAGTRFVVGMTITAGAAAILSGAFRTNVSRSSDLMHSRASIFMTVAIVVVALVRSIPSVRPSAAPGGGLDPLLAWLAAALTALSIGLHDTRWTGLGQRLLWIVLLSWLVRAATAMPPRRA